MANYNGNWVHIDDSGVGNTALPFIGSDGTNVMVNVPSGGQLQVAQTGAPQLGIAQSSTAATSAISNTETVVLSASVAAGVTLRAGSRVRILANGTSTSTAANTTTLRLRLGTAGTTADASLGTFVTSAAGTTGTNVPFHIEVDVTFTAAGSSPTAFGTAVVLNNANTALAGALVNVISNTSLSGGNASTATNLTLTCASAASTTALTFQDVSIEVLS